MQVSGLKGLSGRSERGIVRESRSPSHGKPKAPPRAARLQPDAFRQSDKREVGWSLTRTGSAVHPVRRCDGTRDLRLSWGEATDYQPGPFGSSLSYPSLE